MTKYHVTDNGPKQCKAEKQACPITAGTDEPHYETPEAAQKAYEKKMSKEKGLFGKFKKTPAHKIHKDRAAKRIKNIRKDLDARDQRQKNGTTYHNILKDGYTQSEINALIEREVATQGAGASTIKGNEGDAPVVGLLYSSDYRYEEEEGMRLIAERLAKGTMQPEDISYEEKDGQGILQIKILPWKFAGTDINRLETAKDRVLSQFQGQKSEAQRAVWMKAQNKKVTDLRDELKGKIKPLPTKRQELINAYVDLKVPNQQKLPVGDLSTGSVLTITSNEPLMKNMMQKAKESNDNGTLRVGTSSNPFSRDSVLYDDRDISSEIKINEIKKEEALKAAEEHISETKTKLAEKGSIYSIRPKAEASTEDIREVKYFLNFVPNNKNHQQFNGLYSKDQLDKFAQDDYSDFE